MACQLGRHANHNGLMLVGATVRYDAALGPVPQHEQLSAPTTLRDTTRTQATAYQHCTLPPTNCAPLLHQAKQPALIRPRPGDVPPGQIPSAKRLLTDNPVPCDPDPV